MSIHPNIILGTLLLASVAALFICGRVNDRALTYALVAYGLLWGVLPFFALTR